MRDPIALIQDRIEGRGYDHDIDIKCQVALCLIEKLKYRLDEFQSRAIVVGRARLLGRDVEKERAYLIDKLFKDDDPVSSIDFAVNRLAISAISTNEGLSGYAAEFLVEWGETAGLDSEQICNCIEAVLGGEA